MVENVYRFIASEDLIADVRLEAIKAGAEASAPLPLDSGINHLNAPISASDIKELAEIITVICGAGVSITGLLQAILALAVKTKQSIILIRGLEGKGLTIMPTTSAYEIEQIAKHDQN